MKAQDLIYQAHVVPAIWKHKLTFWSITCYQRNLIAQTISIFNFIFRILKYNRVNHLNIFVNRYLAEQFEIPVSK